MNWRRILCVFGRHARRVRDYETGQDGVWKFVCPLCQSPVWRKVYPRKKERK